MQGSILDEAKSSVFSPSLPYSDPAKVERSRNLKPDEVNEVELEKDLVGRVSMRVVCLGLA